MFDRFIRLAKARKALTEGRFAEAARLADDPLIREDRRAEDVRERAQRTLFERGRERLAAGDPAAAKRDLEAALAIGAHPEASRCLREADERIEAAAGDAASARQHLDMARHHAEQGRLGAAERGMAAAAAVPGLANACASLRQFVAARRGAAAERAARAEELLRAGRTEAAIAEVRAARALDDGIALPFLDRLLAALAAELVREIEPQLATDPAAGAARYRQRTSWLADLPPDETVRALGDRLAAALGERLAASATPETEVALLHAAIAEPPLPLRGERVRAGALALQQAGSLRTAGKTTELAIALETAAAHLGGKVLPGLAKAVRHELAVGARRLAAARELAAAGDLAGARAALLEVLETLPMHEEARAELDAIDRGLRERSQRLAAAREAAREGRLREAYALALAESVPGEAGDDARGLARELRTRMDLVGRGIDQVRAAVHGRESAHVDGLRHCIARLDELQRVQQDHEELPQLRQAILAEIEGVERCEAAQIALAQQRLGEVATALGELASGRERLLQRERLDARILALADRLVLVAEDALAAGRLAAVEQCLRGLAPVGALRADLAGTVQRLQGAAAARRDEAERMIARAEARLAERDLAAAEEACDAARQLWADGPRARKLEERMRTLRDQEVAVQRVAALAKSGDLGGAHAGLEALPPTPPLLRTRIFDLKQSLARAQGLEGGFLLRVDEGGEFLVLRGETISIGNVREGRADLPILAAIAGRHAHVRRSMSFHGGMQDTIVAESGELLVEGQKVDRHRLRSGDRIQLGSALRLHYTVPSSRSLSAGLQLIGGFQVAGTDRVLLMKDRGRDGRILIGPGTDVHVRVGGATGEIELFATKDGQVRIRCDAGGSIDGKPFRGEHPLDAGAMVQAAGVGFVLLPWQKQR